MAYRFKVFKTFKDLYESTTKLYSKLQNKGYDKIINKYEQYFGKEVVANKKNGSKDNFVFTRTAFPPRSKSQKESRREMSTNAGGSATFVAKPFKLYMLEKGPEAEVSLTRNQGLQLYKHMFVMRAMETSAAELYQKQEIRGFCHLYDGQEAVATGMYAGMTDHDCVITSYRSHGWTYIMGGSVLPVLAELTGKLNGCSRGKGGSMHMYAKNFYGGNGIVGAQVPLGLGIAFAHKYRGAKGVCFTLYGDGAANQGQVHESFNIAKLWNMPCVFVIENNQYAMGTSAKRGAAETNYFVRGQYIPGIWVNGMDVVSVYAATKFAINYCSEGKGPLLVEMSTYRYHGHSMSDPGTSYRDRKEIQDTRAKADPIAGFKRELLESKLVTEDDLKKINKQVKDEIKKDVVAAVKGKEPPYEALAEDVYCLWQGKNNEIRNVLPWKPLKHARVGKAVNVD